MTSIATVDTEFDIGISYSIRLPPELLWDITGPLEEAGASVHLEDRGTQVYAGVEWLMPTAIVLLLSRKYIDTIMQEAAKDHYALLKSGLSKLLKKTIGRDREIRIQYLASEASPHKLSDQQPGAVSIYIRTRAGQVVKFIFEDSLEPSQHERCLDAVFQLVRDHETSFPQDALSRSVDTAQLGRARALIMRFNPETEHWYLWQPSWPPKQ